MNEARDYQAKVTHRIQVTIPIVVEVETMSESVAEAIGAAITTVGAALKPEQPQYRWLYNYRGCIDSVAFGATISSKQLPLKPIPPPEVEAQPEA